MEDTDRMEDLKKQGLGAGKASSSASPANLEKRKKSVSEKRKKLKLTEDTDEMEEDRTERTRRSPQDTSVVEGEIVVWDERNSQEEEKLMEALPFGPSSSTDSKKHRRRLRVRREGRCVDDISEGKERFQISAINTVDDEKPPTFAYIRRMMYPDWCNPLPLQGCHCSNGCADSSWCPCVVKNGGEIPYNFDGAIIESKPLVFECGPSCRCPDSCPNRVTQHGFRFQLEIFKTVSRGWGVRSLSSIPSGSFICEYVGELLEDTEAENRSNDEYLFDVGHHHKEDSLQQAVDAGFTIDAAEYGNVARFINHSCFPNLYAQDVLYDHTDTRIPHVMLFAAQDIPPLQELTYHYNYKIGQVLDKDGKPKLKNCYCGSSHCKGRMY